MFRAFISVIVLLSCCLYGFGEVPDFTEGKLDLEIPDSFDMGDHWEGFMAFDEESYLAMMVYYYEGDTWREELYEMGASRTGVSFEMWQMTDSGENSSGFEWSEIYEVAGSSMGGLIALVGKNMHHNIHYVVIVFTGSPVGIEGNKEYLMNWFDSIEGLK